MFPEGKKSGRTNASIRILVAMSVLKEGFGCSDFLDASNKSNVTAKQSFATKEGLNNLADDATKGKQPYHYRNKRIADVSDFVGQGILGELNTI